MDEGQTDQLAFFAFDLLHLNGVSTAALSLLERKPRLERLFKKPIGGLQYSDHVTGGGPSVVGWTDPEGSRSHIGALLLGYYTDDGRLHHSGRAGTGMTEKELRRLAGVLAPLQVSKMPTDITAAVAVSLRCRSGPSEPK